MRSFWDTNFFQITVALSQEIDRLNYRMVYPTNALQTLKQYTHSKIGENA